MENWTDFEKYLIGRIDNLEKKVTAIQIKISKSGAIAGAITGGIPSLVAVIYLLSKL